MLSIGEVLSVDGRKYTVKKLFGRGAVCAAFFAECETAELSYGCVLKEYAPKTGEIDESGVARFMEAGRLQSRIRGIAALTNGTPPVSHVFRANGTAYIDVACFSGETLAEAKDLTPAETMRLCLATARAVRRYHAEGYLCLDLKPENIFILRSAPDETVTQLVEFIDFDGVTSSVDDRGDSLPAYTEGWAAPELKSSFGAESPDKSADLYALGELVFSFLFGRHSTEEEHRLFSDYPFDSCEPAYARYVARPDVRGLFTRLFRGTLRSAPSNRFSDALEAAELLESISAELERRDYVVPRLPSPPAAFTGRDAELRQLREHISRDRVVFLTGLGGIGKSSLIRAFISRSRSAYDVIVYLEYEDDIKASFADDNMLRISTLRRRDGESTDEYFDRKLSFLGMICEGKKVLFVVDNFSGPITGALSSIFSLGFDTVAVTRSRPPKNSFACMELGAISDEKELFKLIALNLDRPLTRDERQCFGEIIGLVRGHTLTVELIARQIAADSLDVREALDVIRQNGFSRFSDGRISNYKDGEEVYGTLSSIVSALFDAGKMSPEKRAVMKTLSLLDSRGLEEDLLTVGAGLDRNVLLELGSEGWLYDDGSVRLHPVISEAARHWSWPKELTEEEVLDRYRQTADVYAGYSAGARVAKIIEAAEEYAAGSGSHFGKAFIHSLRYTYLDVVIGGRYDPVSEEEADLLKENLKITDEAIREIRLSSHPRKDHYLIRYLADKASVQLRSFPELDESSAELLAEAETLADLREPEASDNRCYLSIARAWYHTLAQPDEKLVRKYMLRAAGVAEKVFGTDFDLINIVLIPTADMLLTLGDTRGSAEKLYEASALCDAHPDSMPYIAKKTELKRCLIDVYATAGDFPECRRLAAEVDRLNETYRDEGFFFEIPEDTRRYIESN